MSSPTTSPLIKPQRMPLPTTLVIGPRAGEREAAIAAHIAKLPWHSIALILEGMPDGLDRFNPTDSLSVARIAPGCPCCIGNLTMRVTLNRVLRHPPERLYISLASASHLDRVRKFLTESPYDDFLALTDDLCVAD